MRRAYAIFVVLCSCACWSGCLGGVTGGGNRNTNVDSDLNDNAVGAMNENIATDGDIGAANTNANDNNVELGDDGMVATLFPRQSIWYSDISQSPLDAQSEEVISWLDADGGWGLGRMQIDYSLEVLHADIDTPRLTFFPTEDFFFPDCDLEAVPIPADGALEGETGYACTSDGDCHLIVVDRAANRLYEMWRADFIVDSFVGGCLATWDLSRVHGPAGRGENCTSADAAGLPIAALLVTADEVASGEVGHALRFILPNARIRNGVYLHPATHSTGAASGPESAPPYGARLRLRADYPLDTLPNEAARAVARAMQRYGMFLADGGNVALTFQSDRLTLAKWSDLMESRDLDAIRVTDFDMIDGGPRIAYTGDCVREP